MINKKGIFKEERNITHSNALQVLSHPEALHVKLSILIAIDCR
jgi:hypothetical protein